MKVLASLVLVCLATCPLLAQAAPAEIAVVKSTLAAAKDPAGAKGYGMYFDGMVKKLRQTDTPFDTLTDEQVIAGKLAGHKLAIFPFNSIADRAEIEQIQAFVAAGGKLVWFYAFPNPLGPVLGIERNGYSGKSRQGEFHSMRFADDRPPGFPAEVQQQSPNCRIVEKLAPDARVLAVWHDRNGKSTGVPAVILSPRSVYVAHVFWSAANLDQQVHLLLAAIGHFLPDQWPRLVSGLVEKAAVEAGYQRLEDLGQPATRKALPASAADKILALAQQARTSLAGRNYGDALGLARQVRAELQTALAATFPSRPYELRGTWVHPNDTTDWEAMMGALQAVGFNAVFPLMCGPASASYPSRHVDQITRRDHMQECMAAARRHGIEVHVWKANWQLLSPSKEQIKRFADEKRFIQSYEQALGQPEKSSYQWSTRWLDPSDERNRQLEVDMLVELVEKYHPQGIHFDFMRYPERGYCFCDRCRAQFEKWAQASVSNWPQDCAGKGVLAERFRDWRRHLQTTLVQRIASTLRRLDPKIKISLAARASMTGSYDSDAQDWVTWSKEGYLDFLCPMDYTDRVEVLRTKLQPQVAAIQGVVPIYAGLGVSPERSASPLNLCQQIALARELGADGFLVFAWSPFSAGVVASIAHGPTSAPVAVMPHHRQPVRARFEYPAVAEGAARRTYAASKATVLPVRLQACDKSVKQITARAYQLPAAGGNEEPLAAQTSSASGEASLSVKLPPRAGIYVIVVRGEATLADGSRNAYYLRSLPITIAE